MTYHFVDKYFSDPAHPITVHLVGAGGTGSQVLAGLARIHTSLIALDHPGLHVTVFDPDTVSEANIGRQLFTVGDIDQNKAAAITNRLNRFYGLGWNSAALPYVLYPHFEKPNILITCVDSAQARIQIGEIINSSKDGREPYAKGFYWLDFGNGQKTGQIVLGTLQGKESYPLKTVVDMFDLSQVDDEDSGPSCSLAEALTKQDLFINSTLANLGCNLIWNLFRNARISNQGLYLNLETLKVNPIPITQKC